jgi:hypothetical protein
MPAYVIFSTFSGTNLILKLSTNKKYYYKIAECDTFVEASEVLRALIELKNKEEDSEH